MTTKQKQNIERFKAVQAEAKKLKAKNKNLTHVQAVKQAWAILYSKEKKSPVKKKVGALPIGFTGKIVGVPFKVVNQFDIYGEVNAIVENTDTGKKIIVIDGKASTKDLAEKFFTHIKMNVDYEKNEIPKDTFSRIQKFVIGLNKEVKDYNAGKKQTIKKQPLIITAKKKSSSPKKSKVVKIKKSATKKTSSSGSKKKLTYVGVKKLQSGESRYQYKLAGMSNFKKSKETQFYEILKDNKLILGTFNVYGKTYAKLFANVKTIVSTGEKLIAPVVENLYKKIENLPLKISIKPIGKKSKHYEYIDGKNQNTTHQITEYKISL